MRISLHQLTLTDIPSENFIEVAAQAGYQHVCLFVSGPQIVQTQFPFVRNVGEAELLKRRLNDLGLSVWNSDSLIIDENFSLEHYEETLDIAAALGARTVNALNLDADLARAAANLRNTAAAARERDLCVMLEWYRFAETRTLAQSLQLLRRTQDAGIQLNIDVMHLIRNGEGPDDLRPLPPEQKCYAQISDGPLEVPLERQFNECIAERQFPGEGEFPLVDFMRQFPSDALVSIEAPVGRLRESLTPLQRATRAMAGARRIIATAQQQDG